jgi:hypothetical protein
MMVSEMSLHVPSMDPNGNFKRETDFLYLMINHWISGVFSAQIFQQFPTIKK